MYVSHTHVSGSGTPLVTFLSPKFHKPGFSGRISDDSDIPPNRFSVASYILVINIKVHIISQV